MNLVNQKEKQTTDYIPLNGFGYVIDRNNSIIEVPVYGYFKFDRWTWIVHQGLVDKNEVVVTESSTGFRLNKTKYTNIEDAVYAAKIFLDTKRFHLHTSIGCALVKTQKNLFMANKNLRTLALNSILI